MKKDSRKKRMGKNNEAPSWAMIYGACASSRHDYQNRIQDHGHVCSRWTEKYEVDREP